MADDYYRILGVERNASSSEIQKAYRSLARKYHPDLNPNDKKAKERFKEVQQAYDVLNDSEKRKKYDQFGSAFDQIPEGGPWSNHGSGGGQDVDFSQFFGAGPQGASGFEDILRQFMGGRQGTKSSRGRRTRDESSSGSDIRHSIEVPFHVAVLGGNVQATIVRGERAEQINVKIPVGIQEGKVIRLRGMGEASPLGSPGDLLLTVRVKSHPHFTRKGNDLEVKLPITLEEAALGAKVDVPTPHGVVTIAIPPGTSGGKRLRLRGQGVHPPQDPPGDLYAEVQIVLKSSYSAEELDLIRKLCAGATSNPREGLRWQ